MNEYFFDGYKIFILDDNPNRVDSFRIAVEYLKYRSEVVIFDYQPPFWNSGILTFSMDEIYLELSFIECFGGTFLKVKNDISEENLLKAQYLAGEIYNTIHKKLSSP